MSEQKIYTIYRATNIVTNKCYVGFTSDFNRRRRRHLKESKIDTSNVTFHKAIRKWGEESFTWDILYQSKDREHTLTEMEPHFIKENKSLITEWGYNILPGGQCGQFREGVPGTLAAINKQGDICWVTHTDIDQSNGELKQLSLTTIINNGATEVVTSEYYQQNKDKLHHPNKGKVTVYDSNGNIIQVDTTDIAYINGEYIPITKGTVTVKNADGHRTRLPINDPRIISGEYVHISKNALWWNNGTESAHCEKCPGPGWVRGMLGTTNKGQTWWNNGVDCVMAHESPGPDWVNKRLGNFKPTTRGQKCYTDGINNIFRDEHPGTGWIKGMTKKKS